MEHLLINKLKNLISNNNLEEVFSELKAHVNQIESIEVNNMLILLEARFNENEKYNLTGQINHEDYVLYRNKINNSLLKFIDNDFKKNIGWEDKEYEIALQHKWDKLKSKGLITNLISELVQKEITLNKLSVSDIKEIVKKEINELKSAISPELKAWYNLFPFYKIKNSIPNSSFVGIDFGTSTTVISFITYYPESKNFTVSKPETIPFSFQTPVPMTTHLLPSALFYDDERKALLFGVEAKKHKKELHRAGQNYWTSFKTKLGVLNGDKYPKTEVFNLDFLPSLTSSEDVAIEYFKWLKRNIESFIQKNDFPKNIYYSVSIPASFGTQKRKAYLSVLKRSGINIITNQNDNVVLIDEPNAAFLSSLLDFNQSQLKYISNRNILVFDFGAGTCDISILKFVEYGEKNFKSIHLGSSTDVPLGGDDIDMAIVKNVLYKQFIENVGLDTDHITELDKQEVFEKNLLDVAEELKISICRKLSKDTEWTKRETDKEIEISNPVAVEYKEKHYNDDSLTLSYNDFDKLMQPFIDERQSKKTIFHPINTALKNSKLSKYDIDYVILIGGSCYNPYIKNTIEKFFTNSTTLIPKDLQTHVSLGVSLHSAFLYGADLNIIQPVVSETISFKEKNKLIPLIEAGTPIPSEEKVLKNFSCQKLNQTCIEIPIYSSGSEEIFKIHTVKGKFSKNDSISLRVFVDSNKIIHLRVVVNDQEVKKIEFEPFPSEVFTPYEREVKELEAKIQEYQLNNNSLNLANAKSSIDSLVSLHGKCNNYIKAMETLMNFSPEEYTNIAYYAALAGKDDLSFKYKKLALEKDRNATSLYNFAIEFNENSSEYECYMKEASDFEYPSAQFYYGKLLERKGDKKTGEALIIKAFNFFMSKFQETPKELKDWEYHKLKDIATYLNKTKVLEQLQSTLESIQDENQSLNELFNNDNLLVNLDAKLLMNK